MRGVDGEADKQHIGLGVRERAEAVVFLLAGGVPEGELDERAGCRVWFVRDVVFKDGGDVFLVTHSISSGLCVCGRKKRGRGGGLRGALRTWGKKPWL